MPFRRFPRVKASRLPLLGAALLLAWGGTATAQTSWVYKNPTLKTAYYLGSITATKTGFIATEAYSFGSFRTVNAADWFSTANAFTASDMTTPVPKATAFLSGKYWTVASYYPAGLGPSHVFRSINGISWADTSLKKFSPFAGTSIFAVNSSTILIGGAGGSSSPKGTLLRSTNGGLSWTKTMQTSLGDLAGPFAMNGPVIVAGGQGCLYRSTNNGASWTRHPLPSAFKDVRVSGITFASGKFVAVGQLGLGTTSDDIRYPVVLRSLDGKSWTCAKMGFKGYFKSIAFGNGQFVAVGCSQALGSEGRALLMSSVNGIQWTSRTLPANGPYKCLFSVAYNASLKRFVSVGSDILSPLTYTSIK